jgi:hypothetical protein
MNQVDDLTVYELLQKIVMLEEKNKKLIDELVETKEHLKKYTAPTRSKVFYEKHKDAVKQKVKEYREKTNYVANISPEKKKEYNRIAYLNKKNKIEKNESSVI